MCTCSCPVCEGTGKISTDTPWRLGYYDGITWDKLSEYHSNGFGNGKKDPRWKWTNVRIDYNKLSSQQIQEIVKKVIPSNVAWAIVEDAVEEEQEVPIKRPEKMKRGKFQSKIVK